MVQRKKAKKKAVKKKAKGEDRNIFVSFHFVDECDREILQEYLGKLTDGNDDDGYSVFEPSNDFIFYDDSVAFNFDVPYLKKSIYKNCILIFFDIIEEIATTKEYKRWRKENVKEKSKKSKDTEKSSD